MIQFDKRINISDEQLKEKLKSFSRRVRKVPRCGALIVNSDGTKMLGLFGLRGSSIALPKGKRSQNESLYSTACREVFEETGINITDYSSRNLFCCVNYCHAPHYFFVCFLFLFL